MKIRLSYLSLLAGITVGYGIGISAVNASTVVITPSAGGVPSPSNWNSTYLGDNGGTGHSEITNTAPRSGNGSIELFGDRTRFVDGNYYFGATFLNPPVNQHGLLSNVQSLTFDWSVAMNSTSLLSAAASPALILYVQDGSTRSQLIWEGAYNGQSDPSSVTKGQWYTTGASDNFYLSRTGYTTDPNNGFALSDFARLQSQYGFTANAYISAIGVGVGGSVGNGYHAFADNVTFTTKSGASTTYNFETNAPASTVPDTGSTLALLGLAAVALVGVRQKVCA